MLEEYKKYAKNIGIDSDVEVWIDTTLNNYLKKMPQTSQQEVEHLLDFFSSSDRPRKIKRMSFDQATRKATVWTKNLQKKGASIREEIRDTEELHLFPDGSKIVKLIGKAAFDREGYLMRHCVASYFESKSCQIYSYRDVSNKPHATFEVTLTGSDIVQIKGKGNGPIHPKYIEPILTFLQIIGKAIRPSEMINLGYAHISKDMWRLLQNYEEAVISENIHILLGERYAF